MVLVLCVSVCVCACLSVCLSIYLSVFLSVCLCACLGSECKILAWRMVGLLKLLETDDMT